MNAKANRKKPTNVKLLAAFLVVLLTGCVTATKQLVSLGGEADYGIRLVQEEKYDEAIVELERVIAAHPHTDGKPWYWLAAARFWKGMYPETVAAMEQAFVAGNSVTGKGIPIPLRASAYDLLGWSYHHMLNHTKAIETFETALKWSGRAYDKSIRFDILAGIGWSKYYLGTFEGALRVFEQTIPSTPATQVEVLRSCYRGMAFVNLALGRDDQVRNSVAKAKAAGILFYREDLAYFYLVQGKREKALELWGSSGWIGVRIQDDRTDNVPGIKIVAAEPGGPAERAGLVAGDIIRSMEGQPVTNPQDFVDLIKHLQAGKVLRLELVREGRRIEKPLTVGSAETVMARMPILGPVLKARPINLAETEAPAQSPIQDAPPLQPAPALPPETSVVSHSQPATVKETKQVIDIDALAVVPEEVPAGSSFEVRIDLYAESPEVSAPAIAVTFTYAILRDGKVLKQFDPETIRVANGQSETVTKKLQASKTKGDYTVDVQFELNGRKAQRSTPFSIK